MASECPNCPNQGWYVVPDPWTGEAMQEQCEHCYTVPDSVFNTVRAEERERVKAAVINEIKQHTPDTRPDGPNTQVEEEWCMAMMELAEAVRALE